MYVQHKKDAKQLNKDTESGPVSIIQDVIAATAPKEAQIGSPILNGRKTGVSNPAFEM